MTSRHAIPLFALLAILAAPPALVCAQDPAESATPANPQPSSPEAAPTPASDAPSEAKPALKPRDDPYSAENYRRPRDPGLKVGDKAPDVTVTDFDGKEVTLESMYAPRPLVVVFVKGGWCSVCSKTMRGWQARLQDLDKLDASLIMICPQKQMHIDNTVETFKLEYPIFCDQTQRIARAFKVENIIDGPTSIRFRNHYKIDLSELSADGTWNVPAHSAFIIDTDGTIIYAKAFWPASVAPTPEDVVEALRKIMLERELKASAPPSDPAPETSAPAEAPAPH